MEKYELGPDIPKNIDEKLREYPELTKKLLYYRGVTSSDEAEKFLNPDYEKDTHDPFLMKGMRKAVKRILKAIKENEKIIIYSDYDADGIPGAVILYDFFKKIGFDNFRNYIPHRDKEGFGLNNGAIEEFKKDETGLIITIDCGITDNKEIEVAKELGMNVIITDHHLPNDSLPKAYAIVNPNQKGDKYPCKLICGSAVIFKLVQALIEKGDFDIPLGWEKWLLDMVGLATVADMVPLKEENRTLSTYGLKVLRKSPRPGLRGLLRKANINQNFLTEDDISFVLAPRINAASRMDQPILAFDLLSIEKEEGALERADYLNKLNDERKGLAASMVKEVKRKLSKLDEIPEVIVSGNPRWRPGLLGLVANVVAEEFDRPVFLWGRKGSEDIKGSCRSNEVINVFKLMSSLPRDFFIHFGGHEFSGGFSVSGDNVHLLEEELLKGLQAVKGNGKRRERVIIDSELSLNDVNWRTEKEISTLSPYGKDNPKPLFIFKGIEIDSVNRFGKYKNHLKLDFLNGDERKPVQAIGFFMSEDSFERNLAKGAKVDMIASLEKSHFRNYPELRLRIVDIF